MNKLEISFLILSSILLSGCLSNSNYVNQDTINIPSTIFYMPKNPWLNWQVEPSSQSAVKYIKFYTDERSGPVRHYEFIPYKEFMGLKDDPSCKKEGENCYSCDRVRTFIVEKSNRESSILDVLLGE